MINPCDRSEIDNHTVSGSGPYFESHDYIFPNARIGVEFVTVQSGARKHCIDKTGVEVEDIVGEYADDNHRNEVRKENYGLGDLLEPFARYFGQHNGKHNLNDIS
ncbi:hypothetical protein D3C75_1055400 [compost metagenome]